MKRSGCCRSLLRCRGKWWLLWTSVRAISLKVGWKARLPRLLTDWWRLGLGESLWLAKLLGR